MPGMSPPTPCAPPACLVAKPGSLDTVQALFSSRQNISMLSTLFRSQIQSTAQYGLLGSKLTPLQTDQVQVYTLKELVSLCFLPAF